MALRRARALCAAPLVLQLLLCACAQPASAAEHAAHAHGGAGVTPAGTPTSTKLVGEELLRPGLYRATYELPLRPMRPGEVAITSPSTTLLPHPDGRVGIVDWQFDIVYAANGSAVPLNALYNHHFVVSGSVVSAAEAEAGVEWPPQLLPRAPLYSRLAAANVSFNAGPCEYARYIYGGGAEWRGVQRDQAFAAERSPWPPKVAWMTGFAPTLWGVNLHIIDLRGVTDVRNCVQCTCAPKPGGGVQCCPDRWRCNTTTPDAEDGRYVFRYAVTFIKDIELLQDTRAIIHSVLTTESYTASNGITCAVEYNPSTCGATGPEPAGAWVQESTCVGNKTQLAFEWTIPAGMDIDLHYAVGHQHIGSMGIELFAAPPGSTTAFASLCDSRPRYDRGFVVSMSACDFRAAPRRLTAGTKLRVVSSYHAAPTPLKEAVFQLPWQGVMGYMNLEYTLAPGATFGVITATGVQERSRATAPSQLASGPAAPAAPVCLARTLPAGVSRLTATNVTAGAPAAAPRSAVLTRSPSLLTMEWTIDASRGEVAITLSINATGVWFGLGIHSPGGGGGMVGADMVVAQRAPGGGGGVELAEYFADAFARPTRKADAGGGSGLAACAFAASPAAGTRITFTRPLRGAKDGKSADVVPGAKASVAWAVGAGPTLAPHAAAGRADVVW